MPASRSKTTTDAADAGKQVNGAEIGAVFMRGAEIQFTQRRNISRLALHLAQLPALHSRGGYMQRLGKLTARHRTTQQRDKLSCFIKAIGGLGAKV